MKNGTRTSKVCLFVLVCPSVHSLQGSTLIFVVMLCCCALSPTDTVGCLLMCSAGPPVRLRPKRVSSLFVSIITITPCKRACLCVWLFRSLMNRLHCSNSMVSTLAVLIVVSFVHYLCACVLLACDAFMYESSQSLTSLHGWVLSCVCVWGGGDRHFKLGQCSPIPIVHFFEKSLLVSAQTATSSLYPTVFRSDKWRRLHARDSSYGVAPGRDASF
jgi:hypothetical protein